MHTFENAAATEVAQRISYMLDNGWELTTVCKYAVTLTSRVGSTHTIVVQGK